jgi:hypothetical protein
MTDSCSTALGIYNKVVEAMSAVTRYGSMFEAGRRSS